MHRTKSELQAAIMELFTDNPVDLDKKLTLWRLEKAEVSTRIEDIKSDMLSTLSNIVLTHSEQSETWQNAKCVSMTLVLKEELIKLENIDDIYQIGIDAMVRILESGV